MIGCVAMSELGDRLSELRLDRQELQKDIAELLHVSAGTVSNYETGTHLPTVDALCELADHFCVSTDFLLGRTKSRISTGMINKEFVNQQSYGVLIERLESLPMDKRRLVWELIDDIRISCYVKQKVTE